MRVSKIVLALSSITPMVIGSILYIVFIQNASIKSLQVQLESERNLRETAGVLRYGTVKNIDPIKRTVTIEISRPSLLGNIPVVIAAIVPENALILRQELAGSNGVYDSLPPPISAALSDVKSGDRVAVYIQRSRDQILIPVMLFGNPL